MENIKVYEMPGCISCRLKFALGKAKPFEAFFDGGVPDKNYPAVYVATSIGQQLAIENSHMFAIGKIRAAKIRKAAKPVVKAETGVDDYIGESTLATELQEEVAALHSGKSYPEVTTLVDAIAVLKSEYGVSATRLKSESSVLRVADEKGVSFPNLKA